MTDNQGLVSKVLVFESHEEHEKDIREFCSQHLLVPVKPCSDQVLSVLTSNVDLGAIFLSQDTIASGLTGLALAKEIHRLRPELPIFFRSNSEDAAHFNEDTTVCASYSSTNIESLSPFVSKYIFCRNYPNSLIRGIEEITINTLNQFFNNVDIEVSAPYLVRDRIIFGELFSLIPIDSNWCRGYMTLQSEEANVRELLASTKISDNQRTSDDFRIINDVLSEITNVAWGAMRNRFVVAPPETTDITTQVPIIVNHKNKYITFGTDTPQLCFKHVIHGDDNTAFTMYFKFIFNLHWDPDNFSENEPSVNELVQAGDLEFF